MEENVDTVIAKYGQKAPKKHSKLRAPIISLVILLAAAALVVGALAYFNGQLTSTKVLTNGPSASSVVDKILADSTVTGSKNDHPYRTSLATSDGTSTASTIVYQQPGYNFLTNVPAQDGVRFVITDPTLASKKTEITEAIKTVLTNDGFVETAEATSALSPYPTVTYVNAGTVCQILDFANSKESINEQGVVCANYAALDASYNSVNTLMAKADSTALASAKTIEQNTITDLFGTKKILVLAVLPAKTTFYFATLDTDYEYLGNHATDSKTAISDVLKKNISDPKWGTFLTDNIK